jgi:hypothetical protein
LYRDGTTLAATLTGVGGGTQAFTTPINVPGTYTAKVLASVSHCEAAKAGSPAISRNSLPTQPTIAKPDDVCLNGGDIVFTASGYSGSLTWTSAGGGVVNNNTVTFASTATGIKTVTARSAQTYTNAPTCISTEVMQSADVLALPATPNLAVSASTVCVGTSIVFRVTNPVSGANYTWTTGNGTPSGTGNCSYTVSGATTGTKSVTAYASLTSNGTTCQSGNVSLSAFVSQPSADGQEVDASCGCASGLTSCTNTNTCRTPTTTYQDGECTGSCNTRYRYNYNECGTLISSGTFTDNNCYAGCSAQPSRTCSTATSVGKRSAANSCSSISNFCWTDGVQVQYTTCYMTEAECKTYAESRGYLYYYYYTYFNHSDKGCIRRDSQCYLCNE